MRGQGSRRTPRHHQEKIVEKRVEVPVPPPARPAFRAVAQSARGDLTTMFSGIGLKTSLVPTQGDTATEERATEAAYVVEMILKLRIPKPATTLEQLLPLNPGLASLLPELGCLIEKGKVSGFYPLSLRVEAKIHGGQSQAAGPPAHAGITSTTWTPCWNWSIPPPNKKSCSMQADMDVVSDGSDGDRMPSFDDYILKSTHFQPTTSYGWPKANRQTQPRDSQTGRGAAWRRRKS